MSEPSRVTELREQLAELGDPEPGTFDVAEATRASILAELADLGAEVEPHAPARPLRPVIHLTTLRKPTPALRVAEPPQPEVLPAVPVEKPTMPAKLNPHEKLRHLQDRLAQAGKAGKNPYRHKLQHQIRALCTVEGWPIPPEAEKTTPEGRSAIGKAAHPKYRKAGATEVPAQPPFSIHPDAMKFPGAPFARRMMQQMGDLGAPPSTAMRIRALRSQALDLLPELEDLSHDSASVVEVEMGLLAETLALGGKLLRARIA